MGERTGIEWTDHHTFDPNATGRVLGAYKTAARRTGCSLSEWMDQRARGLRWCFACRTWKPEPEFATDRSRRSGLKGRCSACNSEFSRATTYKVSVTTIRAIRAAQGGRCALCGRTDARRLEVDHDHRTGAVRGLLCARCNNGLGKFLDDPALLWRAIAYLEAHGG